MKSDLTGKLIYNTHRNIIGMIVGKTVYGHGKLKDLDDWDVDWYHVDGVEKTAIGRGALEYFIADYEDYKRYIAEI